jgi:phosphotransferase system enzyme I (PtsI)
MEILGTPASPGIRSGHAFVIRHSSIQYEPRKIRPEETKQEAERFRDARSRVRIFYEGLVSTAAGIIDRDKADLFQGYIEILMDNDIEESVCSLIESECIIAEYAVERVMNGLAEEFASLESGYMRERSRDIADIGRQLLAAITGKETSSFFPTEPVIIVADELSPAETMQMKLSCIGAFALDTGGPTSHVAILAKSLGIPAVVGLKDLSERVVQDTLMLVDGTAGLVIIDPDRETRSKYRMKEESLSLRQKSLLKDSVLPARTRDGEVKSVFANIGTPEEAGSAVSMGADGIGLFRTEFLYMNRASLPSEDEQYEAYRRALSSLGGRTLVIRTFDIGGDKDVPSLNLPREQNPFLGFRAIRIGLKNQELLKTQLRAVLRAAVFGAAEIMFPMIISVEELRSLKIMLDECSSELTAKKIPFHRNIPIGIMVETPAAALTAPALAAECCFLSIGTNDLTQYTLAVDRGNEAVSGLYSPYHPAVLRLIRYTIDAAHNAGIEARMCGDMAGDIDAVPLLLGMGLDEFSVPLPLIPEIKERIRGLSVSECGISAGKALSAGTAEEVRSLLNSL